MSHVTSILGRPGQGKTSLMKALIRERKPKRILTLDPWADQPDGVPVDTVIVEDLVTLYNATKDLPGDAAWSVGFIPSEGYDSEGARIMASVAYLRAATLVIDEAHEACSQHNCPTEVLRIARRGRHTGTKLWLASLRPADVHRSLTSGSERFFFSLEEPSDREYVRRTVGRNAERIVAGLEPGQFLYKCGTVAKRGRVYWDKSVPRIEVTAELSEADLY